MQACATGDTKTSSDAEADNEAVTPMIGISTQVAAIRAMLCFIARNALLAGLVMLALLGVSVALTSSHIGGS
jgi:hypothetical protein